MSDTLERVRAEVMREPGWFSAGSIRYRLPKGARVVPALRRLEREGLIRPVVGAWWSREPLWERMPTRPAPPDRSMWSHTGHPIADFWR